ncbi:hypothetical protein UA08_05008 [Talaromyces atroroseus]|uniref:Hypervirulence associated protein TUDOR domain-containing protein n=1 Tax=Talaromyces atroroseus TaxID=1441469 RepID=A0A225AVD2_TALAT|nr:hypothetical protein UA08_05008 [Talaromyces atroroseus]OKL59559.1 hypothetical protein UA08_05008 [Talaromyces atroroseus]
MAQYTTGDCVRYYNSSGVEVSGKIHRILADGSYSITPDGLSSTIIVLENRIIGLA